MFLLSVFVLAQFLLSREISGKDEVLTRLNSQINELTQLLALERSNTQDAEDSLVNLKASLERCRKRALAPADRLLAQGAGAGRGGDAARALTGKNSIRKSRSASGA